MLHMMVKVTEQCSTGSAVHLGRILLHNLEEVWHKSADNLCATGKRCGTSQQNLSAQPGRVMYHAKLVPAVVLRVRPDALRDRRVPREHCCKLGALALLGIQPNHLRHLCSSVGSRHKQQQQQL